MQSKHKQGNKNPGVTLHLNEESYNSLLINLTEGFALHEIIYNEKQEPYNYRFLEINQSFERLTGLSQDQVIGKLASEIFNRLDSNWIKKFDKVARTSQPELFESYIKTYDRYLLVFIYLPTSNQIAALLTDITERRQLETQLSTISNKFTLMFNASSDGICVCNLDGEILEVNDTYCQMSGYTVDELIHEPITALDAEESPVRIAEHIQKLAKQSGLDTFESKHLRKDGSVIDVSITAMYMDQGGGKIAFFVRDITTRKRSEKNLGYLASFPEENPMPITEVDLDGQISYANPAAKKLFPGLFKNGKEHSWLANWDSVTKTFLEDNDGIITRDIKVDDRFYQQSLKYLRSQQLIRIYGADITDRIHAEASLHEREARLKHAEEISHMGSWELDHQKNTLTWSDEVYRIFGYQPDEFTPTYQAFLENIYPDDRAKVDAAFYDSIEDGSDIYEIEHRLVNHQSGDIRIVQEKCNHYRDGTGKVILSKGMIQDITEKKHVEDMLRDITGELEVRVQERTRELSIANEKLTAEIENHLATQAELETSIQKLQAIEEELRNNNELLQDTQKVVEEERRRYRDLFEFAPDGYLVTDKNGKILEANNYVTSLLAITKRNLIGKPLIVFVAPEDHAGFIGLITRMGRLADNQSHEFRFVPRSGKEIIADVTVAAVKDQYPQNTLRWIISDITARKKSEEIIHQNSLRNAALSEISQSLTVASLDEISIQNIVVETCAKLIGDGCVIAKASDDDKWLTPVAWHHKKPEVKKLMDSIYVSSMHPITEGLAGQVYLTSRPIFIKNTLDPSAQLDLSSDYQPYITQIGLTSIIIMPLQAGEKTIGTLGLFRDKDSELYTDEDFTFIEIIATRTSQAIHNARLYQQLQKSLHTELETHQQLLEAEKFAAVGRLLASITHEINNPLQTIKNCLYLIEIDTPEDTPMNNVLSMAIAETNRLSKLVLELREINRPPTRREFIPIDLPALIEELQPLLNVYLQEKHINWVQDIQDTSYFTEHKGSGVPDQLKQVFLNLSLNAIDAMENEGGTLTVSLLKSNDNDQIGVRFSDTGPGLSPEVKDKLFEPFVTTKEKGLGLGLLISYDIIQKHQGHIEVRSNPGNGAEFTVWLPIRKTDT